MNLTRCSLAAFLGLCLSPTIPAADFVVTSSGPHDSVGPTSTSGNAVLMPTYAGPTYPCDIITTAGTLTKVNANSLAKDSSWWLRAFPNGFSFIPQLTTTTNYTTLNISHNVYGLFWIKNYPLYRFEANEIGTDDPGIDAQWTNMVFTFHSLPTVTSTGWNTGTTVAIDTGGSSFNTHLALYSIDGVLLNEDNGSGPGGMSHLDATSLGTGNYILVAGGSASVFQDNWGTPGAESGNLNINVNGSSIFNGALESGRFQIINVSVVPEPASFILFGLGAMTAVCGCRRHRHTNGYGFRTI